MAEQSETAVAVDPKQAWQQALADLWQTQRMWAAKANALKKTHRSWTGPLVVATFIGVMIGTVMPLLAKWAHAQPQWPSWLPGAVGLFGTALVSASAYLSQELLGPKNTQDWIIARGIAEALKAEGYIYAAGAPPYEDAAAAPPKLLERAGVLTQTDRAFGVLTPPAGEHQHPAEPLSVEEYIKQRIDTQVEFHYQDAKRYAARLARWRAVGIGLGLLSVVIGVVGSAVGEGTISVWMAVVTTAIATVTAYVYGNRTEFLASSYFATAERLRGLKMRWKVTAQREVSQAHRFVLDCEAALAAQNHAWAGELSQQAHERLKHAPHGSGLPR